MDPLLLLWLLLCSYFFALTLWALLTRSGRAPVDERKGFFDVRGRGGGDHRPVHWR